MSGGCLNTAGFMQVYESDKFIFHDLARLLVLVIFLMVSFV